MPETHLIHRSDEILGGTPVFAGTLNSILKQAGLK
jgi:predicted RNA binding protein YcfA (HicA-like mRNA interferase family)